MELGKYQKWLKNRNSGILELFRSFENKIQLGFILKPTINVVKIGDCRSDKSFDQIFYSSPDKMFKEGWYIDDQE